MYGDQRIIRNEKVRGSNPLSSTNVKAPLTCDGTSGRLSGGISPDTESRPSSRPSDPIADLIGAYVPTGAALFRELPTPSEAAQADSLRRRAQKRHDQDGLPRHLIPVSGIRCGEYL